MLMVNEKIIQIIPAPANMWVENEVNKDVLYTRAVCLALMQTNDGSKYITPASITPGSGFINAVERGRRVVYGTNPNADRLFALEHNLAYLSENM